MSNRIGTPFPKAMDESSSRQKEWMVQIVVSAKSEVRHPASSRILRIRSLSSPAALSVKVTSRMFRTLTLRVSSGSDTSFSTMRCSVKVFPVPAEASTMPSRS